MKHSLVYDSACGPCTRFKEAVEFLDTRQKMSYVGIEDADELGMLAPLAPKLRHRSFHVVSPNGLIWSGASALPRVIALLPGGRPVSFIIDRNPAVFGAVSFVYYVLSRLHDANSCALATAGAGQLRPAVVPAKGVTHPPSPLSSTSSEADGIP